MSETPQPINPYATTNVFDGRSSFELDDDMKTLAAEFGHYQGFAQRVARAVVAGDTSTLEGRAAVIDAIRRSYTGDNA